MLESDADATLKRLRCTIIDAATRAREGHIPSAFSVLDILWVLYDRVMRITPATLASETRDRFILSKGHASLGLYAVLAEKGFFPADALQTFGQYASFLGGHPDANKVPGVEASTGSLGHGLPMAVGLALGLRIRHLPPRVFCLVGDGESNEGSIWEATLLAAHHALSNLCCIIDHNRSTDRAVRMDDFSAKFSAFGWATREIDGHDHHALHDALTQPGDDRPLCIVAHTIKGHGCTAMENQPAWHHRSPTPDEAAQLMESMS